MVKSLRSRNDGFTFVETMFVLVIFSVLLLLMYPVLAKAFGTTERDEWELFRATVYELQSRAMTTQKVQQLVFDGQRRLLLIEDGQKRSERMLPATVTFSRNNSSRTVTFLPSGNIRSFRTFIFETERGRVDVRFQIERGRMHIVYVDE